MAGNSTLLFSFEDMSSKDAATKKVIKYFARAGAQVVAHETSPTIKRTAGITYREMFLTFGDSQVVTLRVKQSGDIYQILINGKVVPIKNQDNHVEAITEIVKVLDAGRTKFQKMLVNAKIKPPPGIKTAMPKMQDVLTKKRDDLKAALQTTRDRIAELRGGDQVTI